MVVMMKSRRRDWLIKWDNVKSPWYTHRLMHRKRVTSELHDSYFRLMTKKTCNSKDWVGYWLGVELLYNSVKTVRDQLKLETRCGWESHAMPKGLSGPLMIWGPEKLLIRCSKESHHPAESWAAGPPVEQPWWTRKIQRWRLQEWGSIYCSLCSVCNSLTRKPWVTLFEPLQ